jgi:NAD(P)-dependent dehydrogenase (short-subunit alcohol dehydrogenase family)
MKRPAQPCGLAPVYVMLASEEASYVSGATIAVTGGKPSSRSRSPTHALLQPRTGPSMSI